MWKGDDWVEGSVYDYDDPAVTGRAAFSLWDHVARVTFDGQKARASSSTAASARTPQRLHRLHVDTLCGDRRYSAVTRTNRLSAG